MANVTCAISGLEYKVPHVPVTLANRETAHPIFYLPQKKLLGIYSRYHKGHLTPTDSYLLFLALIHSTDSVAFTETITLKPAHVDTQKLIANNIKQLVDVIWQTDAIEHPSFKQPSYIIRPDTADLSCISGWIAAWKQNIYDFKYSRASEAEYEKLTKLENKLSYIMRVGLHDANLSNAVANWADMAAAFPLAKRELYKATIRKCFNCKVMFSTPKELLIEIKEYCEENIEAGSEHFHVLMETLKEGYRNHMDYLGTIPTLESLTSIPSDSISSYTLHSIDESVEETNIKAAIAKAPATEPVRHNYSDPVAYVRDKLRFRVAAAAAAATAAATSKKGE